MALSSTHLNERIELFDGVYGQDRARQVDALRRIYNFVLGPLTALSLHRPDLHDLSMFGATSRHVPMGALIADLSRRGPTAEGMLIPCAGKGASMQQALLGTLGEAAERILAVLHSSAAPDWVEFGTYDDMIKRDRRALGPEDLPLFAPHQYARPDFEFAPFEPDTYLGWIAGTELTTGEEVLLPAQLVLFYWNRHPSEGRIGYATSGGLAFHSSRLGAVLHGLYEVIERDAVNLRWYSKIPPLRVEIDLEEFFASHLGSPRTRVRTPTLQDLVVLLNTVDVPIPVFTVVVIDRARRDRAFISGGGAWSRRERALTQAFFEIGQMRTGYRLFPNEWAHITPNVDISELTDFFHAPVYYGHVQNLSLTHWYTSGELISWDEVPSLDEKDEHEEYEETIDLLRRMDIHPVLFDFGSACWPGGHLTKVMIPALTQANIPSHPYLGHPRFRKVPRRLGLLDRDLEFDELHHLPLPFP